MASSVGFGLQLPVQAQSTLFVEPWEASAGPDELVAVARACDDAGFRYVAVCDHVAIPRPYAEAMGTTWWDTMTTLGFLAGATTRVGLLSHVAVLAYRHPLVTAKAVMTLDTVSKGRAILGVGAGHAAGEFEALGVSFSDRGRLLDDALDVVDAALREEFPSVTTPTWSVADVGQRPRPVQSPRPPIWVGGSAAPSLRRAALKGDGWLPQGTPKDRMSDAIATIRRLRESAGLDGPFTVGAITEVLHVGQPTWDVGSRCVSGPPDRLADVLRAWADLGCDQLQVRFRSRSADELVDQISAFGVEVAPLV